MQGRLVEVFDDLGGPSLPIHAMLGVTFGGIHRDVRFSIVRGGKA